MGKTKYSKGVYKNKGGLGKMKKLKEVYEDKGGFGKMKYPKAVYKDKAGLEKMACFKEIIEKRAGKHYEAFYPIFYTCQMTSVAIYRIKIMVGKDEFIEAEVVVPYPHTCMEPECISVVTEFSGKGPWLLSYMMDKLSLDKLM